MGKRVLYTADYCLTPLHKISSASILLEDDRILAIGGASSFQIEPGLEVIDLQGNYATPGMIDTHIHGAGGFDSSTAFLQDSCMKEMSDILARHGTTSFLPTITSGPRKKMMESISAITHCLGGEYSGAKPVGIHLEGPYLNKEKHGSQLENDIRPIDLGEASELIAEGRRHIKIMTMAPELENAVRLIELLRENDIIVSMGHSVADEPVVLRAVDAGASRCAHVFNGMPPLHQRAVGLTAVVLTDDRITMEIILDGTHLHPRMVDLACRTKPKDKIVGVSDAVQGTGLNDGEYHVGDTVVEVKGGMVKTVDGTLAGTTMMLERGWRHLISFTHMDITDAAACMTVNPAKSIGISDRGILAPGKLADISFFDSINNNVRLVVSKGKVVYDSKKDKRNNSEGSFSDPVGKKV